MRGSAPQPRTFSRHNFLETHDSFRIMPEWDTVDTEINACQWVFLPGNGVNSSSIWHGQGKRKMKTLTNESIPDAGFQGRCDEADPDDDAEPEHGRVGDVLENGARVCGAAS